MVKALLSYTSAPSSVPPASRHCARRWGPPGSACGSPGPSPLRAWPLWEECWCRCGPLGRGHQHGPHPTPHTRASVHRREIWTQRCAGRKPHGGDDGHQPTCRGGHPELTLPLSLRRNDPEPRPPAWGYKQQSVSVAGAPVRGARVQPQEPQPGCGPEPPSPRPPSPRSAAPPAAGRCGAGENSGLLQMVAMETNSWLREG